MTTTAVRLHRWDEIALEKVTEMISRKIVTGEREMLSQVYLKKGALVPMHSHESEQMTYVLQGALKFLINGVQPHSPGLARPHRHVLPAHVSVDGPSGTRRWRRRIA